MGELIPRDWVLKNLLFDVDKDVVLAAPSVDAEPVRHGRWIQDDEDSWQCSACGVLWTFIDGGPEDNGAKRCPVCGAKMDLEEENK